ncbi:uncharacterized protein BKA78DRAFT_14101 [Phyllosticta capitalensis]|uniref:uncharacterized protein n=1 Tax=Phyllosticta capitalensis TaxID=121624 RepID=UPI003130500C
MKGETARSCQSIGHFEHASPSLPLLAPFPLRPPFSDKHSCSESTQNFPSWATLLFWTESRQTRSSRRATQRYNLGHVIFDSLPTNPRSAFIRSFWLFGFVRLTWKKMCKWTKRILPRTAHSPGCIEDVLHCSNAAPCHSPRGTWIHKRT